MALANGLYTNHLFTWRRQLLAPTPVLPAVLLPMKMEATVPMASTLPAVPVPLPPPAKSSLAVSLIEIAGLHAAVRLHRHLDQITLRTLLVSAC